MDKEAKQEKTQLIQDILRLHFIEAATYKEITAQTGASRPTARRYIDKFKAIVPCEDLAIKDTYKEVKRRVPFPVRWKKHVKIMVDNYARHQNRIVTPDMRKKIIDTAATVGMNATETFKLLDKAPSPDKVPSYVTVAKVIKEYRDKKRPSTKE